MTRYIDEKDVYRLVEPTGTARVHCSQIDELPRSDVVPKSEWNRIYTELEGLKSSTLPRLRLDLQMANTKVADMAKAEVAREIFEEIEKIMETLSYGYKKVYRYQDGDTIWYVKDFLLAELKKKYT